VNSFDGHHIVRALETIGAPMCMLDTVGVIAWTNAAARRLLGDERGALVGQSFARFVTPEQQPRVRQALAKMALGEAESVELAVTATGFDGKLVDLDVSASVVRIDEWAVGVILVGSDRQRRRRRLVNV
jgi:PAS domain S-box-containing protein